MNSYLHNYNIYRTKLGQLHIFNSDKVIETFSEGSHCSAIIWST